MFKKLNNVFPSESVSKMVVYGGIIVLVVLLLIIPLYQYNAGSARETETVQRQIDEQKELAEAYKLLKSAKAKKTGIYPAQSGRGQVGQTGCGQIFGGFPPGGRKIRTDDRFFSPGYQNDDRRIKKFFIQRNG